MNNEIAENFSSQLADYRRRLHEDVFRKTVMESLKQTNDITPDPRERKRLYTETASSSGSFSPVYMSTPLKKPKVQSASEVEAIEYKYFTEQCDPIFISKYLMRPGSDELRQKQGTKSI